MEVGVHSTAWLMLARILVTYFLLGSGALGVCFLSYADGLTLLTLGIGYIVLPAAALLALGAGMLDRWVEWERRGGFEERPHQTSGGPVSPETSPARS